VSTSSKGSLDSRGAGGAGGGSTGAAAGGAGVGSGISSSTTLVSMGSGSYVGKEIGVGGGTTRSRRGGDMGIDASREKPVAITVTFTSLPNDSSWTRP